MLPKSLQISCEEVEPMAGIEPATDGLRNRCSTTELHWRCHCTEAADWVRSAIGFPYYGKVEGRGKSFRSPLKKTLAPFSICSKTTQPKSGGAPSQPLLFRN